MTSRAASANPTDSATARQGWMALVQVAVLALLSFVIIRGDLHHMWVETRGNPDAAHTYVFLLLAGLLIYLHRDRYLAWLTRGSPFGVLLILLGLGIFLICSWPFNYGYPRRVSIVPMIAGAVLATCGWRVFWLSVPIFMLLVLTIPTGSRYYAFLIIKPETLTLEYGRAFLDMLPGVFVEAEGPDLTFVTDTGSGSIALGESNRGVSMVLPMLALGVFTLFSSIRALWAYGVGLVLLVPIALACNFVRFMLFGLVTIYGGFEPISGVPRAISAVASLLLAYLLYAGMSALLGARADTAPLSPETAP